MNTPREIPPDAGDEFWDCEALKLMVINPNCIVRYLGINTLGPVTGTRGLRMLGFLEVLPGANTARSSAYNDYRVTKYGCKLWLACKRVSK